MTTCPTCHQPATTRDGFDRRGRQRFACSPCHRDFTHASSGAFSGYRWPVGHTNACKLGMDINGEP
jgi:predicted CXXCH cytochrome family protein